MIKKLKNIENLIHSIRADLKILRAAINFIEKENEAMGKFMNSYIDNIIMATHEALEEAQEDVKND